MRDAEKALDLLIHDLRAPLSVAQGYLRLIKEQRLPSVEERDRALAKTMDALGRMSGLCSDAAAFLRAPAQTPMAAPLVPVAGTVDAMCRELQDRNIAIRRPDSLEAAWRLSRPSNDVADALARIVVAADQERGGRGEEAALDIILRDGELHFCFGTAAARDQLEQKPRAPFDAWRGGHGLALPLACRTISDAGGEIWQLPGVRGAVGVALPVESADR